MDKLAESLQCGSKTYLFYDLVIISKETRNNTTFNAMETLKKTWRDSREVVKFKTSFSLF